MTNRGWLLGLAALLPLFAGCGSKPQSSSSKIRVKGKIETSSSRSSRSSSTSMTCATLTSTPASGIGTADAAGNVSLLLDAISQPFNCFLSTPGSNGNVPLVFSSGSSTGSMAVTAGDLDLGSISLVTNGNGSLVAGAALPSTAQLQTTTPPGLSCLAGTWTATSAQTCNGASTVYQLFFTPLPDGTYSNSYLELNGVTSTLHLTGTTTHGSNCISVNSMTSLAVGQTVSDVNSWTQNPTGQGLIPDGTTITSLTACGASQVQLSQTISGSSGAVSDSYLITVCGTTAHNTNNIVFDATKSTVAMTYPQACYDVALSHISGGSWATTGAGFIADLSPGSKCISNLKFPSGTLGTSVLNMNFQVADADFSNTYFNAGVGTKIAALPGTCGTGNFQMSVNANATGTTLLTVYNLPLSAGINSFMFYGSMTSGSPCVMPVLPGAGALTGFFVAESAGAVVASAGAGVSLVPASGSCTGSGMAPYMLSEPAGSKATTGESFVIVPGSAGKVCSLGMCFDANGNGYGGAATCPAGSAALTAQTEVDTLPINADCSRMWAGQSATCRSAFDNDQSLGAHCGAGQNLSNTPLTSVRARYAQTNTGCAACFPTVAGAPSDYPVNGCVGYGTVTCTANSNGGGDSSNIVVIKR